MHYQYCILELAWTTKNSRSLKIGERQSLCLSEEIRRERERGAEMRREKGIPREKWGDLVRS